jgi:vacuolar-type H+-ATPase subunit C/Vma6
VLTSWDDVVARVRGLASRLIGRPGLEQLAASRDLKTLIEGLQTTAYRSLANLETPTGRTVERETRRVAGRNTDIIAAWCGERADLLAPLFEDEDRRNLRSLARGIVANQPPDQRVAGLLPTPALPSVALEELARSVRVADLAATLSAFGNPYGQAMMSEAVRETPNLFALQLALDREYATRALKIAPRAADCIVEYVRMIVDEQNVLTALAVAAGKVEHEPTSLFIAGGALVSEELFGELTRLRLPDAMIRLAPVLAATPLAGLAPLARATENADAILTTELRGLRRTVRRDPLSIAVVLEYMLALRAELHDLALIICGIALDVAPRRIAARLVTP